MELEGEIVSMDRRPEPEMMDDPAEAEAYAITDFSDVNERFAERFGELMIKYYGELVVERSLVMVDLGCGPGDITHRVRGRFGKALIAGLDGAPSMLKYARSYFREDGLEWIVGDAKCMPFRRGRLMLFLVIVCFITCWNRCVFGRN